MGGVVREDQISAFQKGAMSVMMVREGGRNTICTTVVGRYRENRCEGDNRQESLGGRLGDDSRQTATTLQISFLTKNVKSLHRNQTALLLLTLSVWFSSFSSSLFHFSPLSSFSPL